MQWVLYAPLRERFNIYKKMPEIKQYKTPFENEWWTNDEHVIAKMYKHLLRIETEDEQVKRKWAMHFGYNIYMNKWESMLINGLKFTLCYNLRENFYKITRQPCD